MIQPTDMLIALSHVPTIIVLLWRWAKAHPRRALVAVAVLWVLGGAFQLYDDSVRQTQAAEHFPCTSFLVSENVPCDPSVTLDQWSPRP
jgi:hypothetical protein